MNQLIVIPDMIYAQHPERRLQGPPYPACLSVFTDAGSFWHVLFGMLAGAVPEPWNLGTAAMFAGYELSKGASGESVERTSGKFIEFGIGLMLTGLIQFAGGYR